MNILIVEDEVRPARALERLLQEVRPEAQVVGRLEFVADTVAWLQTHPAPDLIFMDIHLSDGSSFEVFQQVPVACPVIFVTAYDEHALEAFQANGIEYLLKPITRDALLRGLQKFDALGRYYAGADPANDTLPELLRLVQRLGGAPAYKTSWLIPYKNKLLPIAVHDMAHFVIQHGSVHLTTADGQQYAVDSTLDELETQLDPQQFFRANRQALLARTSVVALEPYYNGRTLMHLQPPAAEAVIVPKLRVAELRKWLSGG